MNLKELKAKYSGQKIPEWELNKEQDKPEQPKVVIKGNARKPKLDKD